jgi:hypothetical protein
MRHSMAYASSMTSLRSAQPAAVLSVLALALSLTACGGSDSGSSTPVPASVKAEQLSLELESSIDRDTTTAFSEQLDARWSELEPKASGEELTTSAEIDSEGGRVSISGGGVTCVVTVVNEPPAVTRICEGG